MFDYKFELLDPIMQANVVLKNNYKMSKFYITTIVIENVLLIQSFCNIIGNNSISFGCTVFNDTNLKQFPFPSTLYILSFICTTLYYLVMLQTLNLSLLPIIRKKKYSIFFTIYPQHIETLKVLEKLITKIDISMMYATLTINQIFVKC